MLEEISDLIKHLFYNATGSVRIRDLRHNLLSMQVVFVKAVF